MLDTIARVALGTLVSVWLVYPAVMMVLARFRRRPPGTFGSPPHVTVVIASREPVAVLRRRVENVLDTAYDADRLEVVVAVDGVVAAAGGHGSLAAARVKVVAADAPGGKAAALNAGVRAANGEVLVFADTYPLYERDTIPALVAALGPGTGVATGVLRLPPSRAALARAYWGYEKRLRAAEARVHSSVGATGAVYAMRASLWKPLPPGLLLDDVYGPMRIVLEGHRVVVAEGAYALETRESTPSQEFGRKIRTLTGVLQLCAWLPHVVVPWRNPIWIQFVFHKLLRMLTPYLLAIIGIWLVIHAAAPLRGFLPVAFAAAALIAVWIWRAPTRLASRVRDLALEAVLLQFAVVVAGVNGLRGRWGVWHG